MARIQNYVNLRSLKYDFLLPFQLIGLVILGFAVYAYIEPLVQELIEVSNRRTIVTVVLFVLMGLGSLTLIVALFGCCGAYHESPCLLATYFIFLILIFAIQLSGAAAGYFYKEKVSVLEFFIFRPIYKACFSSS